MDMPFEGHLWALHIEEHGYRWALGLAPVPAVHGHPGPTGWAGDRGNLRIAWDQARLHALRFAASESRSPLS